MCAPEGLLSLIYSFNAQIKQIPATNQHFSLEQQPFFYQAYCCAGQDLKVNIFSVGNFLTTGYQTETNLFYHKIITSKR